MWIPTFPVFRAVTLLHYISCGFETSRSGWLCKYWRIQLSNRRPSLNMMFCWRKEGKRRTASCTMSSISQRVNDMHRSMKSMTTSRTQCSSFRKIAVGRLTGLTLILTFCAFCGVSVPCTLFYFRTTNFRQFGDILIRCNMSATDFEVMRRAKTAFWSLL